MEEIDIYLHYNILRKKYVKQNFSSIYRWIFT